MKTDELDEAQGLTAEDVRNWLRANGWTYYHRGLANEQGYPYAGWGKGKHWIHDDGDGLYLNNAISQIADERGESEQAILREINPRMRSGWPSDAALDAHGAGLWIVQREGRAPQFMSGGAEQMRRMRAISNPGAVSCWPCDANGNKTRYPTNEQGEML